MRRFVSGCLAVLLAVTFQPATADAQATQAETPKSAADQPLAGLDEFITEVMKEWKVPGLAVAVVKDGKVIHAKGYGYRDTAKQLPVTTKTVFAIGSITKSFTVTGLGMLADDGKLDWEKPVRSYLPDFQLHDKVATEHMTARDLVTHRSGLPRHDFVWYGDPTVGRKELYGRLRYLEPNKEFRSTWQYQNLMYMTAGVLAEQLTGRSWEEFTRKRIIEPLGMEHTNFSVADSQKADDFALPYSKVKDEVKPVPFHNIDAVGPAGSINSSADAMIRYVEFHISQGKHEGKQLLSATNAVQMQAPQMVMPASPQSPGFEELGESSYGMGFIVSTYRGQKYVEHGGGIDGFISLLSFMPRKKIGVIVLTNMSGPNAVPTIVTRNVYDRLLGLDQIAWNNRIKQVQATALAAQAAAKKAAAGDRKDGTQPSHALADYAGSYEHPAYGRIKVAVDGSALTISAANTTRPLSHFHYDIFETPEDSDGRFDRTKVSFLYNKKGDIDRVTMSLEPAVADIVFTRIADDSMRQRSFLEPLAGDYQIIFQTVSVALRGEHTLTLTVPGQPTYELVPTRGTSFDLKGLNGYSVTFKKDASGAVTEAVFQQPNGNFVAKRKTAPLAAAVAAKPAEAQPRAANGQAADASKPAPTAWTPELMMDLRRIGHVRPSPDGKRVVYTVTDAVMAAEKSEYVAQIHLANADGSDARQLTFAEKSSTDPQWSPDGNSIAFLSERSGKSNLYLLRLSGGEAEQLTDAKSGISAFACSPDGKQIALAMADPPSDDEEKRGKGKDDWRWVEEEPKFNRLYFLSLEKDAAGKREPRKLTSGNFHVATTARFGVTELDWSPDGKSIVFSHRKSPKADHWTTSDVSIVDVASGEVKPLAATPASEFGAVYSPDGKSIAMLASDDPPTWGGSYTIQIVPADGGTARALPASYDHQPGLIGWSADGSRIYFAESRGTVSRVYSVHVSSGEIEELNQGNDVIRTIELNRTRTMFGFTLESLHQPPEAFVSGVERLKPVPVSGANAELPRPPLGKVEVVRWKSRDGLEIEGILTYPVGYEPGKRVPLLLQIHGGPMGVFLQGYGATPTPYPNAAFASRGYAILQPNPRGSSGYGKQFRYANYKDWGGGDYQDLMAGVDHVIAMGVADPERLGVMGWSYGGYMTSWTITQTRRFKAASVGAAVTNLVSFTGTADIPSFLPDYLGTQPWDSHDLYRARSAVFNAKGVTTPTLVQHGEADVRVPVSQGYEFYNALKQQGVPVRMLALPRQPHGPNEPKMMLKVMQTNLEWFDKYLMTKS
jgi:dipeptidyl aminopeptidase/acylaminoacyl peptidase/CubicO group peptidase (beta-lactamase class C family)